ncbi:multidrug ABC transporter ATP-binding protein [Snodgrassella alvi]|nr:multidrug ABC transporter ATP-binding protein [Snodgrassella alvi]PIT56783.1 multidrug ABC transporter ATP-binding protein [Snodgrassella alvi]
MLPFIWSCLEGVRLWLLVMVIMTIGTGILEALVFRFLGTVIDWLGAYTPDRLWPEKGHELILIAAVMIFSIFWSFLASNVQFQTLQGAFPMRLRWNFHRLMLGQSMGFYQDEFAGRVSAKVMQTALAVRDTVMSVANMLVYVLVYFVTSGIILAGMDSWLLLPFILWIVLFVLVLRFLIPKLSKTAQQQADARSLMTGRITDAYTNIATVKLFSHSAREAAYAKASMQEFLVTVNAQMRLATLLDSLSTAINIMLVVSSAGLGIWLWINGQVGVGAIATATAMASRINGLSHWVMWESARLFENIGTVEDGMKILSRPHAIVDKPKALPLKFNQGAIDFEHVNFAYSDDKPLLRDFNLHIRAGEKVGLVGHSGAGKTTLTNLLLRFYDVKDGRILIDGQDIRDVTQDSLRAALGLVTQDTSLLHRSVRDNIVYGRPDTSEEAMIQAAQQAAADGFIPALSDAKARHGYDAHVGERGVKLSGGQRQRIAIARVILKDAPILLLDEATSALDSEGAYAHEYSDASGHVGIIIADGVTISASWERIEVNDSGFRHKNRTATSNDHDFTVFRRYKGIIK